ncbi:spermidine hydroxycinnamoyl transferase-like [Eucalyptus grandis]|uniref:spermidine hydroxycinnamoyl transferase-like n=1 Tax=Eucalyptus grandis TaxID=71139 RepID=UPI00192E8C16|nr:spermidine hydroxycinnamoyl transferase-like [Eucalyptus grandis]
MSMTVRYRDTHTIKPETETWSGYLPLSELDQIDMISHWYTIYFYKPPSEWIHSADAIFNTLRGSLSRVLVPFYPLAGRLEWLDGGRLRLEWLEWLDCNAMGVWLIEAESEVTHNAKKEYSEVACSGLCLRALHAHRHMCAAIVSNRVHDHVKSAIEDIRRQPDLTSFQDLHAQGSTQGAFYGNPNLRVSCWLTLPLNGLDFGWGREIHMGLGNHDLDADFVVLPGLEEASGLVVAVCLQTAHIEDFKKFFCEDIVE